MMPLNYAKYQECHGLFLPLYLYRLDLAGGRIQQAKRIFFRRYASQRTGVDHARPPDALVATPMGMSMEDEIVLPRLDNLGKLVRAVTMRHRDPQAVPLKVKLRSTGGSCPEPVHRRVNLGFIPIHISKCILERPSLELRDSRCGGQIPAMQDLLRAAAACELERFANRGSVIVRVGQDGDEHEKEFLFIYEACFAPA
jgi:hypothetical protein